MILSSLLVEGNRVIVSVSEWKLLLKKEVAWQWFADDAKRCEVQPALPALPGSPGEVVGSSLKAK